MTTIEVVDHDPAWAEQFAVLRDRYVVALGSVPWLAIEHVGSTAVEGLAAKPVLDIDIVVAAADVAGASIALEALGYEPLGTQGIDDRWAFRQPPSDGGPRTHTYVVVTGSVALRNHLGVRDVLRADADLRAEYGALKRHLAATITGMDTYVVAKSSLLARVLERAGLTPDERAAIEAANRIPR